MSVNAAKDLETLLHQNQNAELLRFTTAGSVDDGKSTLIGRLLKDCKAIYDDQLDAVTNDSKKLNREEIDYALLTDGLKSEREQGITIDVAYRYFSTPKRRFIIADTPGHEQYTRNMATGASTANLAIILIDARHGVLTQSKRHGFIASLLEIPHILVAVNKMDLVDYSQERYEEIKKEYTEFYSRLNFKDLTFMPISALCGDNVVERGENLSWFDGQTLLHHLENVEIGGDRNLVDFRFPVQYVNRPNLNFRGFCGQVSSGIVRPGDKVTVLPSGKKSTVKAIETFDGQLEYAIPPQSITLTLDDEIDISRGDMIVHEHNQPHSSRHVEAMLVWMGEESFNPKKEYLIKHTTSNLKAYVETLYYRVDPNTLHRIETETLKLNEIARVSFELFKPINYDTYDKNRETGSFILIDPITNLTMAAGMLIDRQSDKKKTQAPKSRNISKSTSLVSDDLRKQVMKQEGKVLWFTGLSGSGKSTLACESEKALMEQGKPAMILDGDNIRFGLNRDLGFNSVDRKENIRRVAEVAKLMADAGLIVLTSFISPYKEDRDNAREIIGNSKFVEIYLNTSLEVCEERDPKGLYKKARRGDIENFTGINAPYEAPDKAELTIDTNKNSISDTILNILETINV